MRWSSGFSRLTDRPEGGNQTRDHEQPQRASGRSFASVVTRKCPSLNRACFWLRELRVFYTFLNILRLICSVHGYPAGAASMADPTIHRSRAQRNNLSR